MTLTLEQQAADALRCALDASSGGERYQLLDLALRLHRLARAEARAAITEPDGVRPAAASPAE